MFDGDVEFHVQFLERLVDRLRPHRPRSAGLAPQDSTAKLLQCRAGVGRSHFSGLPAGVDWNPGRKHVELRVVAEKSSLFYVIWTACWPHTAVELRVSDSNLCYKISTLLWEGLGSDYSCPNIKTSGTLGESSAITCRVLWWVYIGSL